MVNCLGNFQVLTGVPFNPSQMPPQAAPAPPAVSTYSVIIFTFIQILAKLLNWICTLGEMKRSAFSSHYFCMDIFTPEVQSVTAVRHFYLIDLDSKCHLAFVLCHEETATVSNRWCTITRGCRKSVPMLPSEVSPRSLLHAQTLCHLGSQASWLYKIYLTIFTGFAGIIVKMTVFSNSLGQLIFSGAAEVKNEQFSSAALLHKHSHN